MNDKVCIGIPIYNCAQTLRKTLDSILNNSEYIYKVILSDNCSTDDTALICREYCEKSGIFEYHCNDTNIGSLKNAYRTVEFATGDYYMHIGAHDTMSQDYVKKLLARFEDDVIGVFGDAIDQDGLIEKQYFKDYMGAMESDDKLERLKGFLSGCEHCTAFYGLYRLDVFKDIVMYMKEKNYGGIGWDPLVIMIATFFGKLIYDPSITIGVYDRKETSEDAKRRYQGVLEYSNNPGRVVVGFYREYMARNEESAKWLGENYNAVMEVFKQIYGYFGIWKPLNDWFWNTMHKIKMKIKGAHKHE